MVSGWGDQADWNRNLQVAPALEIEIGGQRYGPTQRFLTPEEVYREVQDYLRRNRWAIAIARSLFGLRFVGSDVTGSVRPCCAGLRSARRVRPAASAHRGRGGGHGEGAFYGGTYYRARLAVSYPCAGSLTVDQARASG